MTGIPKALTGTYNNRPFELIQSIAHFDGSEYMRQVRGYIIGFENGDVKYVLEYDPLLKFDQIRLED